jgi:thioredoxin-dependent peroxiredoxin
MKLRTGLSAAAGLVLAAVAGVTGFRQSDSTQLNVGDNAPAFNVRGSDGRDHTLAEHRGKRAVVLAWFPKAFTGGWTAECKSLRESGDAIRQFNVAYYAISADDADTNKKFAEHVEADYPILADPTKQVANAYGVMGRLGFANRWTFYIGPDGKILYIDKSVRTSSAGADVAAKLAELGIAKR